MPRCGAGVCVLGVFVQFGRPRWGWHTQNVRGLPASRCSNEEAPRVITVPITLHAHEDME